MNQKKILILGVSGLLGFHCQEELGEDFNVLGTYSSNNLSPKNTIKFVYKDFSTSFQRILEEFKPDVIINGAGLVSVDGCEGSPEEALLLNSSFIDDLIKDLLMVGLNNCHLIHISSAGVYGNSLENSPWKEEDVTKPLSVYGHTKLLSEFIALRYKGPVTVIRSDFYGINPHSEKSLLWWIIKNAQAGVPMEGWENIYFSPISARQLSKVIRKLINQKITGLYNIGCTNDCNKYSFVDAVCTHLSLDYNVKRTSLVDDTIRPNYTITDSSKIYEILGGGLNWEEDLKNYMSFLPQFAK